MQDLSGDFANCAPSRALDYTCWWPTVEKPEMSRYETRGPEDNNHAPECLFLEWNTCGLWSPEITTLMERVEYFPHVKYLVAAEKSKNVSDSQWEASAAILVFW